MRLFISTAAALGLCACVLLAACSPQDGSAPATAGTGSSARTANGNTANGNTANSNTAAQTTKPAPAQQGAQNPEETGRISIAETQKAVAEGRALVVDVRDESAYNTSHIKGAKSVPLSRVEERAGELPKDKLIITYCA